MPASPPFKVKALYPYTSEEPDDLTFDVGQLITVDVVEDEEWYTGSYIDASGVSKSGLFPITFVETVVKTPKVPRRAPAPPLPPQPAQTEEEEQEEEVAPVKEDPQPVLSPKINAQASSTVVSPVTDSAPAPLQKQVSGNKPSPPPTTASSTESTEIATGPPKKRNAFADRIAAFNAGTSSDAPTPFNQPKPVSYAKKPFHATPTNSYIPHIPSVPKPAPQQTPAQPPRAVPESEIVHADDPEDTEEASVPNVSLKDRIKLLQQQQAAEAARAEAIAAKKKAKKEKARKPSDSPLEPAATGDSVKSLARTNSAGSRLDPATTGDSAIAEDNGDVELEQSMSPPIAHPRQSLDHQHVAPTIPEEEAIEDAVIEPEIETSALAEQESGGEDEQEDDDDDDDDEDDEEDEEEARRLALRERMAKISGGMGMPGMGMPGMMGFGGMPGSAPPPKKTKKKVEEEPVEERQAPVPILPFATGTAPPIPTRSTEVDEEECDEETERSAPPPVPAVSAAPPPVPTADRPVPPQPPVRAVPPPPPAHEEPVPAAPQAASPQGLTSVIDAHREESDEEESDGAWSESNQVPRSALVSPAQQQEPFQGMLNTLI